MRKTLSLTAVTALLMLAASPVAAGQLSDARINELIDAYVVAHPEDFRGIDALQFKYRGSHIAVRIAGVSGELTADQAADWMDSYETQTGEIIAAGGIPAPALIITKQAITGGLQFWGQWNFPDSWAGQGSPVDIAGITVSTDPCTQTKNDAIWTYADNGSVFTDLGSRRQHNPNHWVLWNVADYVVNFQNQADKGITRLEVKRTAACTSPVNVGAAFDYEANQGGGITSVSVGFGFFSVSYSGSGLHGHWGTDAIWGWVYPA